MSSREKRQRCTKMLYALVDKLTAVRPNSLQIPGKDMARKLGVFWLVRSGLRA